ncbi:SH3 domain-containing protein [Granulicoccus sp. GXG6511]|uniref:SH3 domain-containing protein n=1 Tax=Granulicoccus sp. GXG6511 TaxID=3381351 RepID=UPI003D7EA9D9
MSDDNRDHLPQRAVSAADESSPKERGVGAFRAGVRKFALPAVLVMAVSSGLAFGGLAPKGAETQSVSAVPAPAAALPSRDAESVSRNADRAAEAIDAALAADAEAAKAAEAPTEEPEGEAAPRGESKALTAMSTSPEPSESAAVTGRMFTTAAVNVRSEASAASERVASAAHGDSVGVTGRTSNGFTQVKVGDRTGWISSSYLSKSAPAPSRAAAPATSSRSSAPAAAAEPAPRTSGNCAPLRGLQPRTEAVHQALCANFPAIGSYGGVRADWDAEHPSGRAIDAMTSNQAVGDAVANWARANAGRYGITEVIWNQRIWTTQRAGEGWRMMSDRGSATANHRDHVHISVR